MRNLKKYLHPLAYLLVLGTAALCYADSTTVYHSQDEKSSQEASGYVKTAQSLVRYLAYRDVPFFINQYVKGKQALDYGAGTGISTQFLQKQGLEVTGVDISQEMLLQAKSACPGVSFYQVEKGHVPLASGRFDLVFSSLVMFELASEPEIVAYLQEAKRLMKEEGVFIAVTGSQTMYTKKWLLFANDYPQNKNPNSGDLLKIYLRDADIEFTDYYWTEADYRQFFQASGLELIHVHYPLGKDNEPYPWEDERTDSPFVILVAKKKS